MVSAFTEYPDAVARINESFAKMGVDYSLALARLTSAEAPWLGDLSTLVLRDSSGVQVSFSDVGYGISQLLPILFEIQFKGCLLVEQPELHLHPALQASLMEEIAHTTKRTSGQVILETHSEHMVLRQIGRAHV